MGKLLIDSVSDVHLEFGQLPIKNVNNSDVLLLCGDICVAQVLHDFAEEDDDVLTATSSRRNQAQNFRSFFRQCAEEYPHVIYVLGNHEHYHGNFDRTHDILYTEFERMNLPIVLLERDSINISGVTFVGATMWTDFNRRDPVSIWECQQQMNDYRTIRIAKENYRRLRPEDTLDEHVKTINFIKNIASSTNGPVVVVGHHAPSYLSVKPQYQHDDHINGAYRSDLSHIMDEHPNIKLWYHGHTHHDFDYVVHNTRVICHPRGYVGYERGDHETDPYSPLTIELEY